MTLGTAQDRHADTGPGPSTWWIDIERDQHQATVAVDAPITAGPELAQLSELLEWLVAAGSTSVRVELGRKTNVDAVLLEILRSARERLDGELVATSARADAQRTLALTGLG